MSADLKTTGLQDCLLKWKDNKMASGYWTCQLTGMLFKNVLRLCPPLLGLRRVCKLWCYSGTIIKMQKKFAAFKKQPAKNIVTSGGTEKKTSSASGALSLSFFNYLQLQTYSQELLTGGTQRLWQMSPIELLEVGCGCMYACVNALLMIIQWTLLVAPI